ncbi:MAG TPA: DUF1134 domain-containing protein [Hyphomicrobium sp.]|nr:DUF1134 domain-containing protein [Hyphomicrobium sp.]
MLLFTALPASAEDDPSWNAQDYRSGGSSSRSTSTYSGAPAQGYAPDSGSYSSDRGGYQEPSGNTYAQPRGGYAAAPRDTYAPRETYSPNGGGNAANTYSHNGAANDAYTPNGAGYGSSGDTYSPNRGGYGSSGGAYSPGRQSQGVNDAYSPNGNAGYGGGNDAYSPARHGDGGYTDPGQPVDSNPGGYGTPYAPPPAEGAPYGEGPPPPQGGAGQYEQGEIIAAGHGFFGAISQGLGQAVEYAFKSQGRPNGYILGEDAGGAFVLGLRYGEGRLFTKDAGDHKVYWQGPSVGYDAGAEGSKTMVLVYNMRDPSEIYTRFGGVQGSAYLVGGLSVQFQKYGDVTLAVIRSGVGVRLGANVGYLKYTRTPTWNPL